MRHQHLKESDLVKICERCKMPHGSEFRSEFSGHKHYLCVTCQECGHDMCFLTDEMRSGHDFEEKVMRDERLER